MFITTVNVRDEKTLNIGNFKTGQTSQNNEDSNSLKHIFLKGIWFKNRTKV